MWLDKYMSNTAATFEGFENIDTLSTTATVEVKGSALRAGMVLVDEFGCPVAGLDHKVATVRNSGAVRFLVADLEVGGWSQTSFHANKSFTVVAR